MVRSFLPSHTTLSHKPTLFTVNSVTHNIFTHQLFSHTHTTLSCTNTFKTEPVCTKTLPPHTSFTHKHFTFTTHTHTPLFKHINSFSRAHTHTNTFMHSSFKNTALCTKSLCPTRPARTSLSHNLPSTSSVLYLVSPIPSSHLPCACWNKLTCGVIQSFNFSMLWLALIIFAVCSEEAKRLGLWL